MPSLQLEFYTWQNWNNPCGSVAYNPFSWTAGSGCDQYDSASIVFSYRDTYDQIPLGAKIDYIQFGFNAYNDSGEIVAPGSVIGEMNNSPVGWNTLNKVPTDYTGYYFPAVEETWNGTDRSLWINFDNDETFYTPVYRISPGAVYVYYTIPPAKSLFFGSPF